MASAPSWSYAPGCVCDECEDYKLEMGMTMRYPFGRPPASVRPHLGVLR